MIGFRKGIVYSNIRNSFPEKSEAEINRIAKQSYKNFTVVFFEMLKANTISKDEIARRVRIANPELIRQFIQNRQSIILLAAHQCNWEWMLLATCLEIPKTTSGKIQRYLLGDAYRKGEFTAVLTELEQRVKASHAPDSGVHNTLEQTLMEICHRLVDKEGFNSKDNLFEIGTSSLTLAQIFEQIDKLYPGHLDITDFFDYPTIAQLADYLGKKLNPSVSLV